MATTKNTKEIITEINSIRNKLLGEAKTGTLKDIEIALTKIKDEKYKILWSKLSEELKTKGIIEKISNLPEFKHTESHDPESVHKKFKKLGEEVVKKCKETEKDTIEYVRDISNKKSMKEYAAYLHELVSLANKKDFDTLFKRVSTLIDNGKTPSTVSAVCVAIFNKIMEHHFYMYLLSHVIEGTRNVEETLELFRKEFTNITKIHETLEKANKKAAKEAFTYIKRLEDLQLLTQEK